MNRVIKFEQKTTHISLGGKRCQNKQMLGKFIPHLHRKCFHTFGYQHTLIHSFIKTLKELFTNREEVEVIWCLNTNITSKLNIYAFKRCYKLWFLLHLKTHFIICYLGNFKVIQSLDLFKYAQRVFIGHCSDSPQNFSVLLLLS